MRHVRDILEHTYYSQYETSPSKFGGNIQRHNYLRLTRILSQQFSNSTTAKGGLTKPTMKEYRLAGQDDLRD